MARLKKAQVKLLIAAAAFVVLLACVVLLLVHFLGGGPSGDAAVIYSKGGQQLFLRFGRETVALKAHESKRQVFAGDDILYYDAVTEEGIALYVCDLNDSKARKAGGALISEAAEPLWTADAEGRYVVFQEGRRLRCYDRQNGETQDLTTGVETLYAAQGLPAVFFTKLEGQRRMLFRCSFGQQPERVATGVLEAHFYAQGSDARMLYLAKETDTTVLASLGLSGGVREIARDPAKVWFKEYTLGGNLYYLEKGESVAAASVTLEDPQQAADAQLKEPQRKDYWRGLLTSYLGDRAYEEAMRVYNAKRERDKLRAEVERILKEKPEQAARQDCYAYDGEQSVRLAGGVAAEDVLCLRTQGKPALIYDKINMPTPTEPRTVTLDELLPLWRGDDENAVENYLRQQSGHTPEHAGVFLAQLTASGANEIQLTQDVRGAERTYDFVPGAALLLCRQKDAESEKADLYVYDLTEYGISERRAVDSGVTEFLLTPAGAAATGAYYQKQEAGSQQRNLYFYDGKQSKKLAADTAGFFFTEGGARVLALGSVKDGLCALWVCDGAEAWKAADGVQVGSAKATRSQVLYIARPVSGSGSLYACEKGREPVLLDTEVTEIIAAR